MSLLVQMRSFLEVYRAGSISKAAERLGLTQPAASGHVQALESALEKPLFVRTARGVRPTSAADELARVIGAHLDAVEAGVSAFRARSTVISGTVCIAGPAEFLGHRVAPMLAGLVQFGLKLRLLTGNRERIYQWLDEGTADLAITASRPAGRLLGFTEIALERLMLVAAPDLARRLLAASVVPDALAAAALVVYDEELPLVREYIAAVFDAEPALHAAVTVPDLRIVARLVAAGAGWSVLPDYLCASMLADGSLAQVAGPRPGPNNALYLVWAKTALRHSRVVFLRDRLLSEVRRGAFA